MKSSGEYKRIAKDVARHALVEHKRGDASLSDLMREATRMESSRVIRMEAVIRFVRECLPAFLEPIDVYEKMTYRPRRVPVGRNLKFGGKIAMGGESYVYVLNSKVDGIPSWVLKVNYNRNIASNDHVGLIDAAKEIKMEYEVFKKIFDEEMPGLIPTEYHLVMPGPHRGENAVVIAQRFMGGKIRDVIRGFTCESLIEALVKHPNLLNQLTKFVDICESTASGDGIVPDLLGVENLSIVIDGDEAKLVLLDPHVIFEIDDENGKQVLGILGYLKDLVTTINKKMAMAK